MPLIHTSKGLYIRRGAIFFTCLKEFKNGTFINKRQHFRTITIPPNYLAQIRRKFKNVSLTLFDEQRYDRDTTKTWHKNYTQQNKYYQWPQYWLSGSLRNATPLYTKWLLPINNADVFQRDIIRNLADLGGIQQAEKGLDKNVLEIKKTSTKNRGFIKN